jgi:undecaprenyl-diphosphatase
VSLLEAIILGIVQGATEFLPVSSSGHLVMGQYLLGLELSGVTFEVVVHVATLLSILIVYRGRVVELVRGVLRGEREALRFALFLGVATVPAGVVGVLLGDTMTGLFDDPRVTGVALLVTGTFLWTTRAAVARGADRPLTLWMAVAIGVVQALAITPGISRSGATVTAALWLGLRPDRAAEFAFLMAVPAIAGAGVLELRHLGEGGGGVGATPLVLGGAAAAVTGVLAIRLFLALLRREAFHRFAVYCWGVGLLFLGLLTLNG